MSGFFNPHSFERGVKQAGRIPHCGKCGLFSKCLSPKIEPQGTGRFSILFVGDAPTKQDDRLGELFSDADVLRDALQSLDIDLEDCYMTNAVICHTDRVEPFMLSACRPSPLKAIRELKPTVIVPLGDNAIRSLLYGIWAKDLGTEEKWVGWTIPIEQYGAWVCPTFSLSYMQKKEKDPTVKFNFLQHIKRAVDLVGVPIDPLNVADLESKVEVITSRKQARARLRDLSREEGTLAFDYETTGLKPDRSKQKIVSVSFCLNREDTWACMFHPSLIDELSAVLKSKRLRKVASNMKFEERWTLAKLGHGVRNWHWDTMLVAHAIDNRPGITSVKFQGFVLYGLPDYDSHISSYLKARDSNSLNRIHELEPKDLLLYNGVDSLLEYLVMEKQKRILKNAHH